MFHVHRSNRSERLADALAELVRRPVGRALQTEVIVVQSRGMERWLSLALAQRLGVAAALEFPFPRAFVERVLGLATPLDEGAASFNRERLTWAIAAELAEAGNAFGDADLRRYLAQDESGIKRYELSAQLAHVFDQYAVFRPEMVLEWDAGRGDGFQPELWRRVVARLGGTHVAARVARLGAAGVAVDGLPARVSIFGVSALPPLYLDVLNALSAKLDVHLFQHSPSDLYWSALRSEKSDQEVLSELGLLASLGRQGAELSELLEARVQYQEHPDYVEPGADTALSCLQRDLMQVTRPDTRRQRTLSAADSSVEVAVCHSPTRELQVLMDRLWGWLHADPSLQPQDVLVMVPDVDAYCPHIDAVFAREPGDEDLIPYRIADRAERRANPVAQAVLQLLALAEGRMTASACLDLLQLTPVRERFEIAAADLPEVAEWVTAAGIRWGIDAKHRGRLGQPAAEENTWRFGLARLLVGYCMPTQARGEYCGVLPVDDVEGESAVLVGKLAAFAEALFSAAAALTGEKTLSQWQETIVACMQQLLRESEVSFGDHQVVRRALAALAQDGQSVDFQASVQREVLRAALEARLVEERRVREFMAGGVTFAAMLPMRSIPFRVICLLGMNDDAFPRADLVRTFDKIAAARRLGDRSLRDEDRYLFLEALLSARDRLYVSYVGRDIQDNTERPPSVVVEELLDVAEETNRFATRAQSGAQQELFVPTRSAKEHLVVEHSLSAHAPRYFDGADPRYFSYSGENALGAQALAGEQQVRASPMLGLEAEEPEASVDLGELCRYFDNPARYLGERRLGVRLRRDVVRVEDREPIELGGLESYFAGNFLLERLVEGDDPAHAEGLLRAQGALPVGELGRQVYAGLLADCLPLSRAVREITQGGRHLPEEVFVSTAHGTLTGVVDELFDAGQVHYGYGRAKAKRRLRLWLRHLALCASGREDPSTLVARGDRGVFVAQYAPVAPDFAAGQLSHLLQLFHAGASQPLPFLPDTSFEYAERLLAAELDEAADDKALKGARGRFMDFQGYGEGHDEYVQLAFPDFSLFTAGDPGFSELALQVFAPMLQHTKVAS